MSLFDFDQAPDPYAVMGNPVKHSKSPLIHQLFARQTGQRMEYSAIQVDPGGFEQAVGNFAAHGGRGLNITVPFKEEAFRLVQNNRGQCSDRAVVAAAVNTLVFENGGVRGDNTDGVGLIRDLCHNHGLVLGGRRLLLIGAGGAAKGIVAPLLAQQPQLLWIINRTPEKAMDLAAYMAEHSVNLQHQGRVLGGGFDHVRGLQFDLVINATASALMNQALPLDPGLLAPGAVCYDLMYGLSENPFFDWARSGGADRCLDGLGMLVEQAAESFYIWRGVRPDTAPVMERLRG